MHLNDHMNRYCTEPAKLIESYEGLARFNGNDEDSRIRVDLFEAQAPHDLRYHVNITNLDAVRNAQLNGESVPSNTYYYGNDEVNLRVALESGFKYLQLRETAR